VKISVDSYWNVIEAKRHLLPDAAISIMDATDLAPSLLLTPERHLRIGCHDITKPENGKISPTRDQISRMIAFAEYHRKSGAQRLLVHCMAGVSRSPAAAYIIAVSVRREGPVRAAAQLFEAAPFASPNMLMVKHADELGGWRGSMVTAIRSAQETHRKAEQFAPFAI
jgi:predicted protein tyrosine phosphatase